MPDDEYTQVSLPRELIDSIEARLPGSGFDSVSNYITYVMSQFLANIEDDSDGGSQGLKEEDEKEIKKRLEALGYIE